MNTKDNKDNRTSTRITIPVNDKDLQVSLENFPDFFEKLHEQNIAYDLNDVNICLEELRDLVVDGASNTLAASELKRPLKFIRELQIFFKAGFYELK